MRISEARQNPQHRFGGGAPGHIPVEIGEGGGAPGHIPVEIGEALLRQDKWDNSAGCTAHLDMEHIAEHPW
jgi:hypothetical protein